MQSKSVNLENEPVLVPAFGFIAFVWLAYFLLSQNGLYPAIDVVGVDDSQFFKLDKARKRFLRNGRAIIAQGLRQVSDERSSIVANHVYLLFSVKGPSKLWLPTDHKLYFLVDSPMRLGMIRI